jgi:hypothetical protein
MFKNMVPRIFGPIGRQLYIQCRRKLKIICGALYYEMTTIYY